MSKMRVLAALVALLLAGSAATSSYTLKPGDTLYDLARRFRVSVKALAVLNGITDANRVAAGRVVRIPDQASAKVAEAQPVVARRPSASIAGTYTVRSGDTLAEIAGRHDTTIPELMRLNGLQKANVLREGASLTLPKASSTPASPAPTARVAPTAGNVGLCPVKGAGPWDISDSFGAPRPGGRSHNGNDIFARRGAPVVANVSGQLRLVQGSVAGLAYYLTAADGTTYYGAHLGSYVRKGGSIKAGETIGLVGNTGNADVTPPHLHFEVKPGGGGSVNPHAVLASSCR